MKLENGDQLYFQTKLTWKNAWFFPMRFIIQLARREFIKIKGKEYSFEHVAVYVDGNIYESLGQAYWDKSKKGSIKTPYKKRLKVNGKDTKIIILRQKTALTDIESIDLKEDYEKHLGRKYNTLEAAISWFENWLPEKLRKRWFREVTTDDFFCSKFSNMGFYNIGKLSKLPRLFTPNESFIHWSNKCNIIEYDK